ncbi:hypothetical protein GCM10011289_01940 [Paludibacterium paludis]|uniref:SprA family protein n=2 Tax=Paludibacterium paludis TaxID=1225769 RepID=A0A918NX05_9NEIS|nr:hypothetical protein GCM10011289_01940 [Paludibacterium paludis]
MASDDTKISADSTQNTSAVTPFNRDNDTAAGEGNARDAGTPLNAQGKPLTDAQQEQLAKLKARDAEVRQHEAAHMAASGGLAGSPSYTYQRGPDGGQYAIGGEVSISMSPGSTPAETISRARKIRASALAPAEPSGQDRSVAAAANAMEAQARAEQAKQSAGYGKDGRQQGGAQGGSGTRIDTYA